AAAGRSTWQGADDGPAGRRRSGQVGATSALRRRCGAKLLSDARIGAGRSTEARSELSIRTDLVTHRCNAGSRRDLGGRGIRVISATIVEHVIENARHVARFAVADSINTDTCVAVAIVEALDPGGRGFQELRLARHHQD